MFGRNRFPKSSHVQKHLDIQPKRTRREPVYSDCISHRAVYSVLIHKKKEESTTEGIASPRAALIPVSSPASPELADYAKPQTTPPGKCRGCCLPGHITPQQPVRGDQALFLMHGKSHRWKHMKWPLEEKMLEQQATSPIYFE